MKFEWFSTPSPFAKSSLFYPLIGGYDPLSKNFLFERDYYPAYEILFITQGRGSFRVGKNWIDLSGGDCLLHDMRYPHAYRTHSADPYHMFYLVFDGIDLGSLWGRLFHDPVTVLTLQPLNSSIVWTLQTIIDGMQEIEPQKEWKQSSLIYQLLMQTASLSNYNRSIFHKPENIEQAKRYIDLHYLSIKGIKEVALEVNLSLYHFIRQFKKYYGYTPKDYILLKQINQAKRLLILTDSSVIEVCEQAGFESYNAFLHAFQRAEQCTPSDFRRNWKKN
jgi:AraC family transcriptional regulator